MLRRMATEGHISKALKLTNERIEFAFSKRVRDLPSSQIQGNCPRLVAVSKTKPVSAICEAYQCGHRHFGENYVAELVEKSKNTKLMEECPEIQWHFIGHLQKNKVNKIVSVPNLFMVETVDSLKLAHALNTSWSRTKNTNNLKVMVQVNTSREGNKNGCTPEDLINLVGNVINDCPSLEFVGLMTIGALSHESSEAKNPDFQCLVECKESVHASLGIAKDCIELSMGMSHDFEHAISLGSTMVRVGSTIFGAREYPNKKESKTEGRDENQCNCTESVINGITQNMDSLDVEN